MAKINVNNNEIEIEKDFHTNTFWVNPTEYGEHGEVVKNPDYEYGVQFDAPSYTDGIEIPDKLVTINGATNYHLLDAINIDWDKVKIPWAKKITKWAGRGRTFDEHGNVVLVNRSDLYEPDYEYNKPGVGGWTDGTIKETEDVADILNYLIYRVIAFDYFMDHWNDNGLQSPAIRLVNHRTDWYPQGMDPDVIDGDKMTEDEESTSDGRLTVKQTGLIVNLYPYLVSRVWRDPSTILTEQYKTKLWNSTGYIPNNPGIKGVVVCDTGWDEQRTKIYCGTGPNKNKKIVAGGENFDIYDVETTSNSTEITFISRNKYMVDGFVQNTTTVTRDDDGTSFGGQTEISTVVKTTDQDVVRQTNYLYKLPIVAFKCWDKEKYDYNTLDILNTLIRYNYVGIQNPRYMNLYNTNLTPQFDPSSATAVFGVYIEKSQNAINGYKGDSKLYNITINKGNNTLRDFRLDKSVQSTDQQGNPEVYSPFYDSHNNEVIVKKYKTNLGAPENVNYYFDSNHPEIAQNVKSKIIFDAEFGPAYDADYYGSDDEIIKKSYVYPYFIVRHSTDTTDWESVQDAIIKENYETLYSGNFDFENSQSVLLFSHKTYGRVIYEKDVNNKWDYYYYPAGKYETIDGQLEPNIPFVDGKYELKLYGLMYYPIYDKTTNRLLNPLWAELSITINENQRIGETLNFNHITHEMCVTGDEYVHLNQNLIINDGYIVTNGHVEEIDNENYLTNS